MNDVEEPRAYLSAQQAAAALESLTDADWLRLHKLANFRAPVGMVAADLLHEALVRVLGSERRLPSDVAVVPALDKIMNSIALTEIKARGRHPLDSLTVAPTGGPDHQADVLDPGGSPEERLVEAQTAKYGAILGLFSDHDAATYAIEALAAGYEPSAIRSDLAINETRWNSLRRLIRRRIDAAFPEESSS